MKNLIKILFAITLCLPFTLSAQWTDSGAYTTTNDNITIGSNINSRPLLVDKKTSGAWQALFHNYNSTSELGATVHLSHGKGYGMSIRGYSANDPKYYTLQLYNKDERTNIFYNDGRVGLGLAGDVGIGTDEPTHKLTVTGSTHTLASFIQKEPSSKDGRIKLQGSRSGCVGCSIAAIEMYNFDSNEGASGSAYPLATVSAGMQTTTNKTGYLRFFTNPGFNPNNPVEENGFKVKERMRITSNGNVGIGTTTPGNKLEVNGTIRTKEIIVEATGWPDYVFYNDYNLPTLEEEEKHIEAKGHLLGFESEADMAGEIQLGDVSKRQQAKIEEMMLHLIEIKKEVLGLNNKVAELEKENDQLKKQISKN